MTQALYRKWRSQAFGELVGQEMVTRTLRNAILQGRTAHAYLFCGPRGTGKTSTGRILAKALNCQNPQSGEPCNTCQTCQAVTEGRLLDLIEIDAASNRGIDEIRDLREKVRFAPTQAKRKVYIIDEVHMLTEQAFNALLKTLEEPPEHVVFILATTEVHKLPATIVSRCQRFDFRRIRPDAAMHRLIEICESEHIEVDEAALTLIVRNSAGSLRDAENLLDQVVSYYGQSFDSDDVRGLLGLAGDERSYLVVEAALRGDLAAGLGCIHTAASDGVDLRQFNREITETLRRILLIQSGAGRLVEASDEERTRLELLAAESLPERVVRATKRFSELDLKNNTLGGLPLELALYDSCVEPVPVEAAQPAEDGYGSASRRIVALPEPEARRSATRSMPPARPASDPTPVEPFRPGDDLALAWRELLERFKGIDPGVRPILLVTKPVAIDETSVVCTVPIKGNVTRVEKMRPRIEAGLQSAFGHPVQFVIQSGSASLPEVQEASPAIRPVNEVEVLLAGATVQHAIREHGATVALDQ